ncbi:glutamate--tRNA ligase family protein [Candidatus Vidania fulgoroideorum]
MIITRFAPNNIGNIHIGNIKIAFISWFFYFKNNGFYILRIDSILNKKNSIIYKIFKKFKISINIKIEQKNRKKIYFKYLKYLYKNNFIYIKNYFFYFKYKKFKIKKFYDIKRGFIYNRYNYKDFIISDINFNFTYNFMSIIDDINLSVNLIIRGSEHIENTFKQLAIYKCINKFNYPLFIHLSILVDNYGKKISKSYDNKYSIINILNINNIFKRTIYNYIFGFIKKYKLTKINLKIFRFNFSKLKNINNNFIKKSKSNYINKLNKFLYYIIKYNNFITKIKNIKLYITNIILYIYNIYNNFYTLYNKNLYFLLYKMFSIYNIPFYKIYLLNFIKRNIVNKLSF